MQWTNWITGNFRCGKSRSRIGAKPEISNANYLLASVFSLATYGGFASQACATPPPAETAEVQDKAGVHHAGAGWRPMASFYAGKAEEARKWASADREMAKECAESEKPARESRAAALRALARADERRAAGYAALALPVP